MYAPVGKSGPFTILRISANDVVGLFTNSIVAVTISVKLCGGMFVAIPTAIPFDPFTNKLGMRVGRIIGSVLVSSYVGWKSTVSLSMSASNSSAIAVKRASV